MKRFYRKCGTDYLVNGTSRLRVGHIHSMKLPDHPGKAIKVFRVDKVDYAPDGNPINQGDMIAIAFPEQRFNAKEHVWRQGETFQVPVKIEGTPTPTTRNVKEYKL